MTTRMTGANRSSPSWRIAFPYAWKFEGSVLGTSLFRCFWDSGSRGSTGWWCLMQTCPIRPNGSWTCWRPSTAIARSSSAVATGKAASSDLAGAGGGC